nr:MAG TPA_asm: hypothetical protein [Caudoviricetes sp.]DAT52131.1 MAG TPA: hypothetical protein [Caudoviricetes sp.]
MREFRFDSGRLLCRKVQKCILRHFACWRL